MSIEREENEKFYDEVIAPKLLEISKLCSERGMGFTGIVFNEGDSYRTFSLNLEEARQRIVRFAVLCDGNVDALIMALLRDAEKRGHSSAYLSILTNPHEMRGAADAMEQRQKEKP